ncbi:MAG: hypothetical protein R2828_10900 [Saprospiraceae bacterium]
MKAINIIFFLSLPLFTMAQAASGKGLSIGYYGDFFSHPGLKITYEVPLAYRLKTKDKPDQTIQRHKLKLLESSFIWYQHQGNHIGLILLPEYTMRRTNENGSKRDFSFGLGYHRSFLNAKTYVLEDGGTFSLKKWAGQNTLFASFTYGLGKDYRWTQQKPWAWDVSFGLNARTPYNSSVIMGLHANVGLTYFFNL